MNNGNDSQKGRDEEIEAALLDAELFIKYKAPQRAIRRLQAAVEQHPRSIELRERLREYASANKFVEETARQCLALASLYIAREDFNAAHDRLLEAKRYDPRISITSGLEAIRRARRTGEAAPVVELPSPALPSPRRVTFAGDLSVISIFDAIQVIENSRLTGALAVEGSDKQRQAREGRILFNSGIVVGAECGDATAHDAFRLLMEVGDGSFDFDRSPQEFPVQITALSNTNLILDTLRQLDEESQN